MLVLLGSRWGGGEDRQICGHWGLPVRERTPDVDALRQEMRSVERVRIGKRKRRDNFF